MGDTGKKQVPLRLSAKLYNAIAAWAEDDFRSVNGQIEYLLTECVRQRKKLREKYHRRYGYAYDIQSDRAEELMQYFHAFCAEHSIVSSPISPTRPRSPRSCCRDSRHPPSSTQGR